MVKVYRGKNWVRRFLSRHAEIIVAKPRGLDPKRAQNFNKATITEYFDMRKTMDEKYDGIPPEHNWNVDEKGCQMGGGRKGDNSKFIFSKNNRERYRIHSDNLELVTIIERFSALPTQLRVKPQHPQQVLLSPRQPTICSTHNHHFFRKCKDLFHIMLAPLLSYLHHHSHCCLGILIVTVYITPATHNTYSIRLLHTSHWYTRIYLPNV